MTQARARIAQYLREASHIRKSMTLSREIGDWRRADNEIRYFFDANIVAIFTDPASKLDYFEPLSNWIDSDRLKLETITVMAEYMFSGRLPGQKVLPLMTPYHFEDLKSMAAGMKTTARQQADKVSEAARRNIQANRKLIDECETKNAQGLLDPRATLIMLRPLLGDELMDFMQGAAAETELLKELLRRESWGGGIARADTQKWFHQEIIRPDPELVNFWVLQLHEIRGTKQGKKSKDKRNLLHDAQSIAQLILLGREADDKVKYVLVTADNAIHAAYNKYARSERREGRKPDVLHLRHPRDFVPLINLGAMSNFDAARLRVFDRIQDALDRLLIGLPEKDTTDASDTTNGLVAETKAIAGAVAFNAVPPDRDREDARKAEKYRAHVDQLKAIWSNAASDAVTLNAHFISRRVASHFRWFMDVLGNEDVVEATLQKMDDWIGKLMSEHVQMALRGIVARYLEKAQARRKKNRGLAARRAPLLLRTNVFRNLIGDETINKYLDDLVRDRKTVPLDKLGQEIDDAVTLLFGACVAVAAEEWESARSFAEGAVQKLEQDRANPDLLSDAQYLLALTLRFTMKDRHDVDEARRLLKACADRHKARPPAQDFERMRAESELGALIGSFLFRQSCEPNFATLSKDDADKLLIAAREHIEAALEKLDQMPDTETAKMDVQRIGLQICANRAGLAVFRRWMLRGNHRDAPDVLAYELKELRGRIEKWESQPDEDGLAVSTPVSVLALFKVFRVVAADDRATKLAAAEDAKKFLAMLLENPDLVHFDRKEYEFFMAQLDDILSQGA